MRVAKRWSTNWQLRWHAHTGTVRWRSMWSHWNPPPMLPRNALRRLVVSSAINWSQLIIRFCAGNKQYSYSDEKGDEKGDEKRRKWTQEREKSRNRSTEESEGSKETDQQAKQTTWWGWIFTYLTWRWELIAHFTSIWLEGPNSIQLQVTMYIDANKGIHHIFATISQYLGRGNSLPNESTAIILHLTTVINARKFNLT